MKMKTKKIILYLLLATALIPFTSAQKEANLYLFYGKGCPHCARAIDFLNELNNSHPEINIKMYEVYFNESNRELFVTFCSELNKNIEGVPTLFVGNKTFIGFSKSIAQQIEEQVIKCLKTGCADIAKTCTSSTEQIIGAEDSIELIETNPSKEPVETNFANTAAPSSNFYYSLVGWSFILIIVAFLAYFLYKRHGGR